VATWCVGTALIYSADNMTRCDTNEGVCVRKLSGGPTVEAALVAFFAEPDAFALESTACHDANGRYTILGFDAVDVFERDACRDDRWLDELQRRVGQADARYAHPELPFVGGWVGYISYEAGACLEGVGCTQSRDVPLPPVRFALYDTVAIFDHLLGDWFVAGVDVREGRPAVGVRVDALAERLLQASAPAAIDWTRSLGELKPVMSRDAYFARVERAKRYIEAGDIYQVNLTHRFRAPCDASAVDVYRRVRVSNPSALAALMTVGDCAIISASPELCLTLEDQRVVARPIKGTRPRTGDDVLDAVNARELVASEKDQAELTMIVDLLRNDLGRVSQYRSVRVVAAAELETHPTVFHLVATIVGRLRDACGWRDLMQAALPGGSVTGAPKIRAMQIIDELETTERSVYCGGIGYIGLNGSMCLNIAIRTMVLADGTIHAFSGGAIVADSDPQDEYDETLAKIAGLSRALRAEDCGRTLPTSQRAQTA